MTSTVEAPTSSTSAPASTARPPAPAAGPPGTPVVAVNDIGSAEDFLAAIDSTIKYFNDGDIVEG
nr:hypothetical protein [Actinomycetota bacterium]